MRYICAFAIVPILITGCGIKQSICVEDQKGLISEVYILNCDGKFNLTFDDEMIWASQNQIPSKCENITLYAMDHHGRTHSFRQYKNDTFQAALSAEVVENRKTLKPELKNLYLSSKKKQETCSQQISRHRINYDEFAKKYLSTP